MNNKTLLLIFLFFVLTYLVASRIMNNRPVPPFDTNIIEVDTTRISLIEITPQKGPAYEIHHTEGQWIVSNGILSLPARADRLSRILDQIDTIQTFELISKQPADWDRYGLAEGAGTRIKVHLENGRQEDFIIGKTDFIPELQKSIAYLRLSGQHEVYAVNGFLPFQLERHFNDFRNKTIISSALPTVLPDSYIYQSRDTQLNVPLNSENNSPGIQPDSITLAVYFDNIRATRGSDFADDFDELSSERYFHQRIRFFFNEKNDSLILSCYRDSTRIQPFIIHSSDNPKSYFYSDSLGLYKTVFESFQGLVLLTESEN